MYLTISPNEWAITKPDQAGQDKINEIFGITYDEIQMRTKNAVYEFLDRLYNQEEGALHHYYRADNHYKDVLDSGNFIMAFNYLTMYDRFQDEEMLKKAESCFLWAYQHCTEIHPMFSWQGGVRDGFKTNELYVKYTGDAFWTCLALYRRTQKEEYLFYAKQFHNFLKQARKAGFKYKYDLNTYQWSDTGFCWRAFGYPVIAYLEFYDITKEKRYLEEAILWGEHGLTLQEENGAFYLLDGEFWNSDLTPTELRALVFLYEVTTEEKYLVSAKRFADWLLTKQRNDGAWPIGIDKEDEVCAPNVGPGDMPNIGMSLIRLHKVTKDEKYLDSAIKTMKYSLAMQAVEDGRYPAYLEDPNVKWGFWSWEPLFDYSLSGDQSVHHVRGLLIIGDYIGNHYSKVTSVI